MNAEQIGMFDGSQPYKINKPIRLIELFAGIGSQAKALQNIGADFEHYRICEFDKYAVQSYNAIHGTQFETSDITKINASDLGITDTDKYEYIMTYSFPCFTADSLVLTQNGYRNIDEIIVGDKVLTHTNNYENVTKVFNNGISDIYSIRGMGIDEIKATINHKFYVREMYRKGHFNIRTFTEPRWKEVKDLTKKDYLGIAINQNSIVPNWNGIGFKWSDGRKTRYKNQLSELMGIKDFWWIIGRYIGDGWIRSQGGIIICCAKSETKDVISRVSKFFNYSISEERTVNKIHISLKELELFVSQFGRGAKNKCLTNTIIDLPINLLKEFLDGYWSADGCFTNGVFKASSVSRKLIYGMAQCVAKVYKAPYRIYENIRKPKRIIDGRSVNQNTSYELVFKKDKRKQDKAFYEDGYIWFPIKSIQYVGKENVYDIEVEKDHSFTVQNTMVHNCTDLSKAGQQKGMAKGSGTRSGLLWEVERLLDECSDLPQVLLMENVPDVIGTKNISHFANWIKKLETLGYHNYWKLLNAKDYGIPQNRNRCFMVSVLGDYYYNFPQGFPLELRLKDMLEEKVDEKYYLRAEQLQNIKFNDVSGIEEKVHIKEIGKLKPHRHSSTANSVLDDTGICPTLDTMGGGNREPKVFEPRIFDMYNHTEIKTGICGTLTAHGNTSSTHCGTFGIAENYRIRKLTPKECWRLMGFNDEDFDKAKASGVSNSQLYKQAGNSIVVNVLEAIFRNLF